ncbi:tumor necrosis factor ligand superfamily member 12 [Erpetoichthys calabaricus]|uniref:TNF superfamily member 12 n=1 Tax=Erpetoichthys calabaricus TaxID=27687 RepID=A0A8C4SI46_ERPCA|nr:tumor necrosis factor ligand superfamily member 12 [Erpetoichthys calabaricus]XP_039602954.1 tumor necrosis factor ligand superfamily member 12 [Polypterus senegalus]
MRLLLRQTKPRRAGIWVVFAVLAISVALLSLFVAACSLGQTRTLSQSFQTLQDRLSELDSKREAIIHLLLDEKGLLASRRHRREAPRGSRKQQKNGPSAAHFELPEKEDSQSVNNDEIIKGWQEVKLNVTNPINFDKSQGKFTVTRRGLYYLYCQVHFRDRSSAYLKLFVKLNDRVVFNCLQSHTTTPSSGHSILQDFNSCHVSGLIELPESAVLTVHSIRGVRIHYSQKLNYFGLFKVK